MFDPTLFDEAGDDHMGEWGLSEVHQSIDGGLMGREVGEVAVPKSGTCANDGLMTWAIVGDADGGGDAGTGEDDGMGGSVECRGKFLDFLLDLPIGINDLFRLVLWEE